MAKQLLMGNEALAHAALEAGVNVVAGYPGTPSSEIVETVARLHAAGTAHDVYVEWSTNEVVWFFWLLTTLVLSRRKPSRTRAGMPHSLRFLFWILPRLSRRSP